MLARYPVKQGGRGVWECCSCVKPRVVQWGGSSSIKRCYSNGGELLKSTADQKVQTCLNLFCLKPKICDMGWKVFRAHASLAEIKDSSPFIKGERSPTSATELAEVLSRVDEEVEVLYIWRD